MRITTDTNVLLRAAVGDDPAQASIAADALLQAEIVAVPLPMAVIAFEGRRLGGTTFASFDRSAVELIAACGEETALLPTS